MLADREMPQTSFYLYFPQEDVARRAGERLAADGFAIDVRPSSGETNWLALAETDIGRDNLDDFAERTERLAEELGGEYDGHETAVP
jgi:hypothetical protein